MSVTRKPPVPRSKDDDYSEPAAHARRDFVRTHTNVELTHASHYSIEPASVRGNIENFFGVAQVPMGLAGPLLINGEHAQGEFYIPLATTEGTLVASYNRGMRLLSACGGVKVTVVEQFMQRAPVFFFEDAREARNFGVWIERRFEDIKSAAESSSRIAKLSHIEQYAVGPMRYLRFNYTTGDAAGQNMVGKATLVACEWIQREYPGAVRYTLSGGVDTDKKHSQLNTLHSRGRRVVAEATIRHETMREMMELDTKTLFRARQASNVGAMLAGSVNNGAHSANGITALFIATGQDVANVAESHAAIVYTQLQDDGDYYWSITLPSLIVATYGGGTGLGTQREILEMLGCYGPGKSNKLAEIIGATVLAGEVSLSSAVLAGDWVSSHERLGRNRP
jgi:hydroxymethylglutaryl-CoA reductase (NADPH)